MTIIDSLQNFWSMDSAADISSGNITSTDNAAEGVELAFGSLLSLLQGNDAEAGTDTESGVAASIESIQQSLLSAVGLDGLNGLVGESLSQLNSLSSLANMQTSLLSSLQASLFQAGSAAVISNISNLDADSAMTSLTSNMSEVETATTFLSTMDDFSNFSVGEDGLGLDDVFDTVNVLNHIPVIADIYQDVTDTVVDPIANVIGGYIYGGPLGLAYASVNLAFEAFTGKSIYDNVSDYLFDDSEKETLGSVVTQISETVGDSNKAYSFATRVF